MKIRKEQMSTLDNAGQANFHQRLLIFLREEMPEVTSEFTDDQLIERIVQSEGRASSYGISTELGVTQFVCLTFMAGPDFDEIPEVNRLLKDPGNDAEAVLEVLVDDLIALEDEQDAGG